MLQWWGIFTIFTQIVHEDWMWLGICSPLFISAVLLFVQMPALEQHSDVRFGRYVMSKLVKIRQFKVLLFAPQESGISKLQKLHQSHHPHATRIVHQIPALFENASLV
jgi:Protein of unknown function (DUF1295)